MGGGGAWSLHVVSTVLEALRIRRKSFVFLFFENNLEKTNCIFSAQRLMEFSKFLCWFGTKLPGYCCVTFCNFEATF